MSAAVRTVSVILAAVVPTILTLFATTGVRAADGPPEREPGPRAVGKVYTWHSPDGLAYDFFLPKSYDARNGITLTFILHGSNGWKGWGFGMHAPGEFRPEDFVVSPNGTTPNGRGGFNFLQSEDDLERFHALHEELRRLVKINATYIYGLSQGSFFAHYYAGHHGDDVEGIVAHGSGLWIGSGLAKALEKGFLNYWTADAEMLAKLAAWRDAPKANGLSKALVKRYDSIVKPLLAARAKGRKAYAKLNKKM